MKHSRIAVAATILCAAITLPTPIANAQNAKFDELKQATDDIVALTEADTNNSALCRSYVGKTATISSFDALTRTLPKTQEKGEFETTAQFEARMSAANAWRPSAPSVVVVPINQDYVRYEADTGGLFVNKAAFETGQYSDEAGAALSAILARPENMKGGIPVFHSVGSVRLLQSFATRTRGGIPFRVAEYERQTNALHLTNERLFAFAKSSTSPVMVFEVPLARAPQMKGSLRLALVVVPRAPFLFKGELEPTVPSLGRPNVYTEKTSVAVVEAKCGLALDSQNRVLAAMDAGS